MRLCKGILLFIAAIPFLVIWGLGWVVGAGHKAFSKGHESGYDRFMSN